MIASFQALAGRTLYPAQVERLLIDLYAYRESLVRNAIQYAAMQCLVAFAKLGTEFMFPSLQLTPAVLAPKYQTLRENVLRLGSLQTENASLAAAL